MTNRFILQFTLLLCFSTTALSVNYSLLQDQLRSSSSACQKLLLQLNGTVQDCFKDRVSLGIPEEIETPKQFLKEEAVFIIYEMIQKISSTFRSNFSATAWNETIVENLRVELDWQKDRLETAMEEIMEQDNFTRSNTTEVRLRKYYWRIARYLKAKLYSRCAWTVVQVELLRNFAFLMSLTNYLQEN